MLRIIRDKWDKNHKRLLASLTERTDINELGYLDLVKLTYEQVFNADENALDKSLNVSRITEIDDGDYQGTLLYVIPFNTYQPTPSNYLMTSVSYGSCSSCDTLQGIQGDSGKALTEQQVKDYMALCKDIFTNTIKPFNFGWREDPKFCHVVEEVTWTKL